MLGDAYDPSWACIGVIIAFNPMQELRLDPDLPAVEDEIGEDIAELYKRGIMDTWTVKYGDGSVENITTTPFIHGLQLHQKAVSSQEFRQNLKLKPEVLEMANSPPGFTKMSITEFKYRFCTHTKGKRRKGKEGKEEKEEEKGEDEVDAVSDTVCDICHSGMDEDKILLCDKCDKGFHTDCLNPPVTRIPKGSWFCAACVEIFTCEFCQKQFKTKPGYQYHRKNVCMTEEEEEARNKVLKEDEEGAEVYMEASVDPVTGRKIRQRKRVKRFAPTGFAEVVSDDEDADVVDGHPVAVRSVPGVSGKQRRRKRQEDDDDDDEDAEIDEDEEDESDDDDDDDEDEDDDDDIDDEVDNDNDDDVVIDKSASRSQKPRSRKPPTRRKRGRVMTDFSAYVDNGYQHLRQMFMELPMYEHAKALSGYAAAPNAAITTAGSSLSQLYESFRTNVVTTLRQNPPTPLTDWLHTHPTVHLPTIPVLVRESDDSILSLSTFQASVRPQASGVTNNASASASGSGTAKSFKGRSSAHSNDLHLDYFINAGGPIWDTSFAPLNTSIAHSPEVIYEKYLAVGLSQVGWPEEDSLADGLFTCTGQFGFAQDIAHVIGKPILYPNLLQIWKVSKTRVPASSVATESESAAASNAAPLLVRNMLSATVAADGQSVRSSASVLANGPRVQTEVTLQFCVGLEQRGAVWKTAWSPHTYPASSTSTSSGSEMTDSLVGLLAVVCGDGSCLVLALPKSPVAAAPAAAGAADSRSAMSTAGKGNRAGNSKASTTATSSSTMSTITDILVSESSDVGQTAVIPEDSVCQWEISVPGVAIVSVTWNPHQPLELCCGMTDGTITLWDLTKAKPPSATSNSSNSNPTKTILQQPSRMLMDVLVDQRSPVVAAVNSLQFCPYNPALLSSGGLDGALKIWNIIHSPNKPMFVRKLPHLGYIQDLRWDPYGNGVFCAGPDSTTVSTIIHLDSILS